jgi:DNA-binding transcriptional LysR family regulator
MRFRLNLGSLWELKRTVELGSMTKAAEELGLSQPALTRRIKQMEHDLRVEVLVRDHAGVTPTDMGAMILERARTLFEQTHLLEEEIAAASGRLTGEVAVCLPTSMHQAVTRPFLRAAADQMPDVRIRLIDAFDAILHEQLARRTADVGIIIHDADSSMPGLKLEPLFTDPLFLVGTGGAAGERAAIRIADLGKLRLVIPSQNNGLRRKLDAAFRRARIKPEIMEVDSYRAMMDVVQSGRANTIAPSCSLTPRAPSIWWSPITRLSINWTFAVQEGRMQSIAVRSAGDLLKKQVANWVDRSVLGRGREGTDASERIIRRG